MSIDIIAFNARLVEIGVLDAKTHRAFSELLDKPHRDSRFPGLLEQMYEEIASWHDIAANIRYTCDPALAKTVTAGIKLVYKFAKSSISSVNISFSSVDGYNRKLAKMKKIIEAVEQAQTVTIDKKDELNLRKIALDMLSVYQNALKQQKANLARTDAASLEMIDSAIAKMTEIEELVLTVVDVFSKKSAACQKDLFTHVNAWESSFAYGDFNKAALEHLDKAVISAKVWSLAKLNPKAKPAKTGDYVTEAMIGTRIQALATTMDAVSKIKQAISLIERAKATHEQITDTSRLEDQKAAADHDLAAANARIEEIRELAAARRIDLKTALMEKEHLENKIIPPLERTSESLATQIMDANQRRLALRTTVMRVENVCRNFLAYKDDPSIITLFAQYVNFEALTHFLGGSKLDADINDLVNLAAIEKITLQKFDEAGEAFSESMDEQLSAMDPTPETDVSEEELLRRINGGSAN